MTIGLCRVRGDLDVPARCRKSKLRERDQWLSSRCNCPSRREKLEVDPKTRALQHGCYDVFISFEKLRLRKCHCPGETPENLLIRECLTKRLSSLGLRGNSEIEIARYKIIKFKE